MCDGIHYAKDSVHTLSEQDALNFSDTVTLVSTSDSPVNGVGATAAEKEEKAVAAHPNKMMKAKKATKK